MFPYAYKQSNPFSRTSTQKLPSIYSLVESCKGYRLFIYFLFGFDPVFTPCDDFIYIHLTCMLFYTYMDIS